MTRIGQIVGIKRWLVPVLVVLMLVSIGDAAFAATTPAPTPAPSGAADTCTNFKERMDDIFGPMATAPGGTPTKGILSQIYEFITDIVNGATYKIFSNFTNNDSYQYAVYAAVVLSVTLFGLFFTIGLVQLTAGQVLVRLIKMGLIFAVVSPGGWTFFSQYVVNFFNGGTDELVRAVLQIAAGGVPAPPGSTPFYQLDKLGTFLINPQTLIGMVGAFTTGPFGMGMGALMMMAFGAFIKMLIDALRLYAVCFVVRSLLLGLAPIFIVFLLFERTKQLFNTWLNSLLSCSLQPILLFTFLAFFTVMMESATKNMFNAELCYVEFEGTKGGINKMSGFRFVDPETGKIMMDENTFRGPMSCLMGGATGAAGAAAAGGAIVSGADKDCPEFPIKIIDVMTFLMLVFLASRFSEVIERVANELSSTFISLDPAGKFDQFMNESTRGIGAKAPDRKDGKG